MSDGAGPGGVWELDAIGTRWRIETPAALPPAARSAVSATIGRFDAVWSRFRADSTVSGLAPGGGRVPLPPDGREMLDLYAVLSTATDGAVNPLVGDSLQRLGYDAAYSLRAGEPLPAPRAWQDALRWTGEELVLDVPATIDVGALGKGRLVDLVAGVLEPWAPRAVVDASGDVLVRGGRERIGLEHPYDPRRAIGVVEVADAALCASATTRRAWGDGLHHVLDARTGIPVRTYAATWAIAPTAMLADATATALFFDGGPAFAHAHGVEWVRMTTDGRVEWSPGCAAELFVTGRETS